jgi:hypothetical protein
MKIKTMPALLTIVYHSSDRREVILMAGGRMEEDPKVAYRSSSRRELLLSG